MADDKQLIFKNSEIADINSIKSIYVDNCRGLAENDYFINIEVANDLHIINSKAKITFSPDIKSDAIIRLDNSEVEFMNDIPSSIQIILNTSIVLGWSEEEYLKHNLDMITYNALQSSEEDIKFTDDYFDTI